MSQCLNPDCSAKNKKTDKFCQSCGSNLLLQNRYRGLKFIGQGGFGKTFLGLDEGKPSQPYCVIKQFIASSQENLKSFQQEAERLDELGSHPQIPELLCYLIQEEKQYLVQEYIDGKNLAEELNENEVFNEQEIRQLLIDLLQVLDFVHLHQVIHRDVKPENIIRRAKDKKLVLVDFGAAKNVNKAIIGYTTGVIGTAQYAAPEQLRGESMFVSDLYSLGITCLHLLTNINPFDLFSIADNDWIWREYLNNNLVSNELGKILDKLVEPAVKKRYQSAKEVLQELMPNDMGTIETQPQIFSVPPPPVQPQYRKDEINSTQIEQNPQRNNISLTLDSAAGIDYSKLRDLLAAKMWKEADQETNRIILQLTKRQGAGFWLGQKPITTVPYADLYTIDNLWVKQSNGNFGFSVQNSIFKNCRKSFWKPATQMDDFATKVGWKLSDHGWLKYNEIDFNRFTKKGCFPLLIYNNFRINCQNFLRILGMFFYAIVYFFW